MPQAPAPAAAAAVLALERVAARSWPATETAWLEGWLLRAAAGWTRRANSCLPLDGLPGDLDGRLARVQRWYAERGLAASIAVPLPACAQLGEALARRGWTAQTETLVQTARLAGVLERTVPGSGLPLPTWATEPSQAWLEVYRSTDGPLPPVATTVLGGGGALFASMAPDGRTVAVARCTLAERWAGLAAFEVEPSHRRRGLATHLLHHVAARALEGGAREAWLQVQRENVAALALYGRAGFATHHSYCYYVAPTGGRDR